jgi:hypothetical protein
MSGGGILMIFVRLLLFHMVEEVEDDVGRVASYMKRFRQILQIVLRIKALVVGEYKLNRFFI